MNSAGDTFKNQPDHRIHFLHLLQLWQGKCRQVGEAVQFGEHLHHEFQESTVSLLQVVAEAWDDGSQHLGGSLNISDVFSQQAGAGVALFAGREVGVVSRGALVTENTGDSDPTHALAGFRVA